VTECNDWGPSCRPRLRPGVEIAPADGGRWQIRWDFDEVVFLSGDGCARVLPWLASRLHGEDTLGTLVGEAEARGVAAEFREVVALLREQRFVEDGSVVARDGPAELSDVLRGWSIDAAAALSDVAKTRIHVAGRTAVAERIAGACRRMGFVDVEVSSCAGALPQTGLLVAVEPDCGPVLLERINAWALTEQRTWMLVGVWNRRVLVGPLFVPGETACYVCYRQRLDSHRAHRAAYEALDAARRTRTAVAPSEAVLPALSDLAAGFAAAELFHFTTGAQAARTVGRVLVYLPLEMELGVESVLRIPWCPACDTARTPGATDTTGGTEAP
jgi:ribosomal protein S12 methylthiotransferase accessory factor